MFKNNIYCNKSVGRGVELKEPTIKYNNTPYFFSHNYLPPNYCLNAENIHNLFLEDNITEEPINVINLEKAKDRKEIIEDIFKTTDYNNLKFFNAIKHNVGWVGCALSHINIIKDAYKNNKEYVIVMEDDCMPIFSKIKNSISKAVNILKENEDLDLYNALPYNSLYNNFKKRIRDNAYVVGGGILAHFVIYHKRCFERIIKLEKYYTNIKDNTYKQHLAIDELLTKHFNMFTLYPFMMYQFSDDSYIESVKDDLMKPLNVLKVNLKIEDKINNLTKFKFNEESDTTVVCISCGRFNELLETVKSFFETNTYDINNFIIIDDSNNKKIYEINDYYPDVNIIQNPNNGHSNNLELGFYLSKQLKSKYIFLIEEDWKFIKPYYLEQSKHILENNENIINVWLRDLNDTNGHPLNKYCNINNINCYKLEYNYNWHGFTFNPSLKRLENFTEDMFNLFYDKEEPHYMMEKKIDNYFYSNNFHSVILPFGYIYHTGYITSIPQWLKV